MLLTTSFFEQPTLHVAKSLIGKHFHCGQYHGLITETEAYIGQDDPACHAARGRTPRNAVMFGPAGTSYVYLIYGMYHCLNVVTEGEGFPAAVLLRGVKLLEPLTKHLDGPGKLCRECAITRDHSGISMVEKKGSFYFTDEGVHLPCEATSRIGIKVGTDKLWRFVATSD